MSFASTHLELLVLDFSSTHEVGTLIFWFHYGAFYDGSLHPDGVNLDWVALGSAVYHAVIWAVNMKLCLVMSQKSQFFMVVVLCSCIFFAPCIQIWDSGMHKMALAVSSREKSTMKFVMIGTTGYIWWDCFR